MSIGQDKSGRLAASSRNEDKVKQAKTAQFWYNPDRDKHYVIDWTGNQTLSDTSGKPIKTNRRYKEELHHTIDISKEQYIPSPTKFEGYTQFRCPKVIRHQKVSSTSSLRSSKSNGQ